MAFCGEYKRTIKGHEGPEFIEDDALKKALRAHLDPKFWDKYRSNPAQYAYVRRWASMVRREARKRGVL